MYPCAGYICWCGSGCSSRHGRAVWHGHKRKTSCIYTFLWQQQGYGWISILETSKPFILLFFFSNLHHLSLVCHWCLLEFIWCSLLNLLLLTSSLICFGIGFLERTFTGETIPYKVQNHFHECFIPNFMSSNSFWATKGLTSAAIHAVLYMLLIWWNSEKLQLGIILGSSMKLSARIQIVFPIWIK